jgi:hypothetical protein
MMKMCGFSGEQIAQVAAWQTSNLFDDKPRTLRSPLPQVQS